MGDWVWDIAVWMKMTCLTANKLSKNIGGSLKNLSKLCYSRIHSLLRPPRTRNLRYTTIAEITIGELVFFAIIQNTIIVVGSVKTRVWTRVWYSFIEGLI